MKQFIVVLTNAIKGDFEINENLFAEQKKQILS
jgi:hypothetical protein